MSDERAYEPRSITFFGTTGESASWTPDAPDLSKVTDWEFRCSDENVALVVNESGSRLVDPFPLITPEQAQAAAEEILGKMDPDSGITIMFKHG